VQRNYFNLFVKSKCKHSFAPSLCICKKS